GRGGREGKGMWQAAILPQRDAPRQAENADANAWRCAVVRRAQQHASRREPTARDAPPLGCLHRLSGTPQGLAATPQDRVNADLPALSRA
ncbi:hypothetical protein, partial [Achromobacter xylosoxidans]